MEIRTLLNSKLKEALKARDQLTTSTVRLIVAAIKERDIGERSKGHAEGISDGDILSLFQTMIKQRRESAKIYHDAKREDLAEREEAEIVVIETFLPKQMDINEIGDVVAKIIDETGAQSIKDMGKIMASLKQNYAGQVDMSRAGPIVKEKLAG